MVRGIGPVSPRANDQESGPRRLRTTIRYRRPNARYMKPQGTGRKATLASPRYRHHDLANGSPLFAGARRQAGRRRLIVVDSPGLLPIVVRARLGRDRGGLLGLLTWTAR